MSSVTSVNMSATHGMLNEIPDSGIERGSGPTDSLSARQVDLDRYWRYYRCSNYDQRAVDWHGNAHLPHTEHEFVATSGVLPAGFYDAGQTLPLKFRRPTAPYYLAKAIVNRFTSLLFSSKRHPKIACDDPLTEDWMNGFADTTRLWSRMIQARTYGGAMGSVGMGVKIVRGKPVIEVHDPRWCVPEFEDRTTLTVSKFEKRYQYVDNVRLPDGNWEERWFWYRRLIDEESDIIWPKVLATGEEPDWKNERSIEVKHGFGFCPIVWIQNQPMEDDIDGDPDCHGCFDLIERIDGLYSQADRGTIANCDPTLSISSDAEFDDINKGSGRAIQTEKGGSVGYVEISGAGIDRAIKLAEVFEEKALTVARCMLDRNEGGPARTAEEVEHNYSAMLEQAEVYREQYGEEGVKRLLEMVLRIAQKLDTPSIVNEGGTARILRSAISLPKRRIRDKDTGEISYVARRIGKGEQIELRWPQFFTPSQESIGKAVDAASKAKLGKLIDAKHATEHVAEYFQIENVPEVLKKISEEAESEMASAYGLPAQMLPGYSTE